MQFVVYEKKRKKPRLELTPLIDVIFILLIFFAVSTTLILNEKGIQLTLPSAKTVTKTPKGVVVSVDKSQKLYWNGKRISESALSRLVLSEKKKQTKLQIILHADRQTPYSMVIRLMDKIRGVGVFDIVLKASKKSKK